MAKPDFWSGSEATSRTVARLKEITAVVGPLLEMSRQLEDLGVLAELVEEEADEKVAEEVRQGLSELARRLDSFELRTLRSEPNDARDCFLSIHAGAGGVDACDWAELLLRMYSRWLERNRYEAQLLDRLDGEEAGLKRVALEIKGPYAYGNLQSEVGVHRLVRISPFDAGRRRHTSFASVDVVPEFDEVVLELSDKDLRVDTYRSSGAGGQHVNVTDSAVRITHLPSGLVVQCQNERSQHMNRRLAMKLLQSKLYQQRRQEQEDELRRAHGEKGEIAWGNQIRSYVLQPYRLVKDHRTGRETGKVQAVLDGEIDEFIEAYLKQRAASRLKNGTL